LGSKPAQAEVARNGTDVRRHSQGTTSSPLAIKSQSCGTASKKAALPPTSAQTNGTTSSRRGTGRCASLIG
jgi:hypothetical protein